MQVIKNWLGQYYSKKEVWTLFLVSVFPIHIWALLLFFWDFGWISERSGNWNALGVGAYALVIALVESIFVLLVALLLGFLISKKWSLKERADALIPVILLTAIWTMLAQLFFIRGGTIPDGLLLVFVKFPRPLVLIYALLGSAVLLSFAVPVWFALNSEKFRKGLDALMERVTLLAGLYLVFDVIAIVIVVWRNNFWLPL